MKKWKTIIWRIYSSRVACIDPRKCLIRSQKSINWRLVDVQPAGTYFIIAIFCCVVDLGSKIDVHLHLPYREHSLYSALKCITISGRSGNHPTHIEPFSSEESYYLPIIHRSDDCCSLAFSRNILMNSHENDERG